MIIQELLEGTWNRRFREFSVLVHKSPEDRQNIVDTLLELRKTKDLSFGERKMLELAQDYDTYKKEQNEKIKLLKEQDEKVKFLNNYKDSKK